MRIELDDKRSGSSASSATRDLVTIMLPQILEQQPVKGAFKSLLKTPGNNWFEETLNPIISNLKVEIRELQEDQTYRRTNTCLFLNSYLADGLDQSNNSKSSEAAKADAIVSKYQYEFLIIASLLNELGHYVWEHLGRSKADKVTVSGNEFTLVAVTISLVETNPNPPPKIEASEALPHSHADTTVLDPGQVVVVNVFGIVPEFEATKVGAVKHYIFRYSTELKNIDRAPNYPTKVLAKILEKMPQINKVQDIKRLDEYIDEVPRYHSSRYRRVGLSVLNRTHAGTFAKRGEEETSA